MSLPFKGEESTQAVPSPQVGEGEDGGDFLGNDGPEITVKKHWGHYTTSRTTDRSSSSSRILTKMARDKQPVRWVATRQPYTGGCLDRQRSAPATWNERFLDVPTASAHQDLPRCSTLLQT